MNEWQRSVFAMFAEAYGQFDVYENFGDASMTLEFSDGERVIIPEEVTTNEVSEDFARYLLQLFTDKYADRLTINKAAMRAPVDVRERIVAINEELDIIRGRVPTPKGYKVNVRHAKALMDELNKLIKTEV